MSRVDLLRGIRGAAHAAMAIAAVPVLVLFAVLMRYRSRSLLVWGPDPILNNRHWSRALAEGGHRSCTLMRWRMGINQREDFDLYFDDLLPRWIPGRHLRSGLAPLVAFGFVLARGKVVHIPFSGGPLGHTAIWRLEAPLLRLGRVAVVIIPYGYDVYMYSRVMDLVVRQGLLASFPGRGRTEPAVRRRVEYWSAHADVIVVGFTQDGLPRWDVPVGNMIAIDTTDWRPRDPERGYSDADGRAGTVRVLHAPNHRGIKGTEFIVQAVDELRAEGLAIELVLLENVVHARVREVMSTVDALADQLILPGYGLAAIEAMATGLPVIANLEDPRYTGIFRAFSFLDECPILSAGIGTVKDQLRLLVTDPELRSRLGRAGRSYVEKYHSFESARYLFGSVYRYLAGEAVDLMNLFHPLKSDHVRRLPRVDHPLVAGHLPAPVERAAAWRRAVTGAVNPSRPA